MSLSSATGLTLPSAIVTCRIFASWSPALRRGRIGLLMSANSSVIAGVPASLVSDWRSAASLIDHTLLKPEATRKDVMALCDEAVRYGFHSVVVNPTNVAFTCAAAKATFVGLTTTEWNP